MSGAAPPRHSDAFERFVRPEGGDDSDVVGLLAYALYKRDKRELAIKGDLSPEDLREHHKRLTDRLVEQQRATALQMMDAFSEVAITDATPQIGEAARFAQIESAKAEIIAAVAEAAKPGRAILWNVVAWLVSLALTIIVVVGTGYAKITFPSLQ